ncbi:MAG: TonB-dependent receptor [Chitinophagales bacterium]
MRKFYYFLLLWICMFALSEHTAFAQELKIRGTITEENMTNKPIEKVLVFVKTWAYIKTYTDKNGKYTIVIPEEHPKLVFVKDGYEPQEIEVGVFGEIDVVLKRTSNPMNQMSVTSGKNAERTLDAPADISIIKSSDVKMVNAVSPTDYLKGTPGIDIMQTSLTTSNVSIRGFNNIFTGTALTMVDNRIVRVPALHFNANQLFSFNSFDIDHIEVLKGPASALYGPNSSGGVIHFLTLSPLDIRADHSTTVSTGIGIRASIEEPIIPLPANTPFDQGSKLISMTSFRHLGKIKTNPNRLLEVGYKISGQYLSGNGWSFNDPNEPKTIVKNRYTLEGKETVGESVSNERDNTERTMFLDGRMDFRFNRNTDLVLSSGISNFSGIEMTGVGAVQVADWSYSYLQARLNWKSLFAQVYTNRSSAGNTHLLWTGTILKSSSQQYVAQIQNSSSIFKNRVNLLYGLDAMFTRSDTEYSIHGSNENDDAINEYGGYLQAGFDVNSQIKLLGTLRTDKNSFVDEWFVSPRAAIIYKPAQNHTVRATYNKAFDSPSPLNISIDITESDDIFDFRTTLGLQSGIGVKASGNRGLQFSYGSNGLPQFRTPFAPLLNQSESTFFNLNDPSISNIVYAYARQGLLQQFLQAGMAPSLVEMFSSNLLPEYLVGVEHNLMSLTFEQDFPYKPVSPTSIEDVAKIKNTTTQSYELGYKGIINNKLTVFGNLYYTHISDVISPLQIMTPNVFLEPNSVSQSLVNGIFYNLQNPENGPLLDILTQLLDQADGSTIPIVGNSNGSGIDELVTLLTTSAASIPLGTVSPTNENNPNMVFSYTNFGDISLWGTELGFLYEASDRWLINGNYAHMSKDLFEGEKGEVLSLNAPKNKVNIGARYHFNSGLNIGSQFRWQNAFHLQSGIYIGEVPAYQVVDLNLGYTFPGSKGTYLSVSIQNLLNEVHQESVGAPQLGRLTMVRLSHTFE